MCGTCGLPATHTGATTILVSSVLPIILVYINIWYFSTKVFFIDKFKTAKAASINKIYLSLIILVAIIIGASPWWLELIYYYTSIDLLYNLLNLVGPRILATVLVLITTVAVWLTYLVKTRHNLLKQLVILLSIESVVLVGTLVKDILYFY